MPTALGLTTDQSPHGIQDKPKEKKEKGPLNTISKRNHADAKQMDVLFWRALTDTDPTDALEYVAKDCAMINPFALGTLDAVTGVDKIREEMESGAGATWTRFQIEQGTFKVVEVGLMAVSTLYRAKLSGDDGRAEVEAVVASTWRQTAGADWFLCNQLVMKAP